MKIGIVTDNTCNIPAAELEKNGIEYASLYIMNGEKSTSADQISKNVFYDEIQKAQYIPKTSQPSVDDFIKTYSKALAQYDKIISVHLSSKLSGTVNSANLAAKEFEPGRITVVDSLLTSWALGFLILHLKDRIKDGAQDISELAGLAGEFHKKTRVFFSVGNLEYLHKGGRIGKGKALLGSILQLKPILQLKDGEIHPYKNIRGMNGVLKELVNLAVDEGKQPNGIAIVSTGNASIASYATERAKEKNIDISKIRTGYIDVVLGLHLGPDSIGVITYYE
ncbi:MAG TPA: DegV family protein [Petrotogaceae bacterium]|nr:DegV family protein [Petrotogaceae bacterium]HNV04626.1 DegV family protein [Petrotogaceae bacterium]HPO26222.1 DegV family protein [Petrotogaceae bacterium]HPX16331.1 DegV family protein [Petrotogaceae bacterium]HQC40420.1 DegV family protein [Petrotogaceae bacterium]